MDDLKPIIDEIRDGVRYRVYPAANAEGYDPSPFWEEAMVGDEVISGKRKKHTGAE